MKLESNKIEDYLVSDSIVDWKAQEVRQKALDLTRSLTDDIQRVRTLYEWVRDTITHSSDAGVDIVTCTASEVLCHGTGICFAKSHLLAALLRAVDIPAGLCYQVLRLDPPLNNELILHGFNGVYLASLKKWIRLDARGNTGSINARFSIEEEHLAFAMDLSAGEFIYETIYAAPLKCVIDKLSKYDERKELWQNLPKPF
ncbi:transglutaminase-like domain-containing protein [Geomonas edaphica]|uniref:transglutaminase-like domain-containing protein n=1 Tax=Geomonas edaphica TaxID=2570226 RepID=UPI0010A94BF5|nr:transglutaminase-like domain-containing protein [Geomonas edaphica]